MTLPPVDKPEFDLAFAPQHGTAVTVEQGIARITANNPGPFTFHGTNSYIIGDRSVALIDPGPDDDAHFAVLKRALSGRTLTHILVTHTHRDHSPLARRLKAATGAVLVGEGPHRAARPLHAGEINPLAESGDHDFMPDVMLADGEVIDGDGWRLRAVATPGHTANHLAFALEGSPAADGILFCGDHVMAWATTIVAPPDGSMADYMASLDRLIVRGDRRLFPGHGGPVETPAPYLRALRAHRLMRERAIVERIKLGDRTIPQIVAALYAGTDRRLHGAAALSVLSHLEQMVESGRIVTEGPAALDGLYAVGAELR